MIETAVVPSRYARWCERGEPRGTPLLDFQASTSFFVPLTRGEVLEHHQTVIKTPSVLLNLYQVLTKIDAKCHKIFMICHSQIVDNSCNHHKITKIRSPTTNFTIQGSSAGLAGAVIYQ
jgi:hypothetical protein